MPGLIGFVATSPPDKAILARMLSAMFRADKYKSVQHISGFGAGAVQNLGLFDHRMLAKAAEKGVVLLLDGWLRGCVPEGEDAAVFALNCYLAEGISFVKKLNGQFNIAIWDSRKQEFFLVNDRYGLRPIQYAFIGNALYFAPEGKAILRGAGAPKILDDEMVLNHLAFGRAYFGGRTFFKGVKVLPPGSILRFCAAKLGIEKYWDYSYSPLPAVTDEFLDELAVVFERAVERWIIPGRRIGITLSGGLDSRLVAAVLAKKTGGKVKAFTFGMPDSQEVRIAGDVARRLGISWECIALGPGDFTACVEEGALALEGLDAFPQSFALRAMPRCAESVDILFNGLALDLTLGGSFQPPMEKESNFKAPDFLRRKFSTISTELLERLYSGGDIKARAESFSEMESEIYGAAVCPGDVIDRFVLNYRVHRIIFQRQYWQRLFCEDATATFDNDLLDLLLKIPSSERFGHKTYQRFMAKICPELMDIPYQRTGLPPSAPLRFWPEAAAIENSREKLLERIFADTGGKVYLPYKRYYSNFDEWLRVDPCWLNRCNMLSVKESRLIDVLGLSPKVVNDFVEAHRSGKMNYRQALIQLLTLDCLVNTLFADETSSEALGGK